MIIFSGNANRVLAKNIAGHLKTPPGKAQVEWFSDRETRVEIHENVRGRDVFVIQPTTSNNHLMELLVMVDALRLASPKRITAVMPYFGYARQDRKPRTVRAPITARLVARMLEVAGADRVLTMDLHADQIQGFFNIPVDNLYASPVMLADIWKQDYQNLTVVSPDVGGVVRARAVAKHLDDAPLAIIDKRRPEPNQSEVMHIIGDVKGRSCVIVDDLVDTARTLCHAAKALKEHGAVQVVAYCTHPVLSGGATGYVEGSHLDELVVSNSIPLPKPGGKIRCVDVAELFAESIRRITNDESVGDIFA